MLLGRASAQLSLVNNSPNQPRINESDTKDIFVVVIIVLVRKILGNDVGREMDESKSGFAGLSTSSEGKKPTGKTEEVSAACF